MTATQHATDHDLKDGVERELDWTSDVNSDQIGVAVNDGAVTLAGEVSTYPEKIAAVSAALRVRGVTAIADEIVVRHRFGPRADADIARAAAEAIDSTVVIPPESVSAAVRHHEVTLTGTVTWQHQRVAAKHAVSGIPGVKAVHNLIELQPVAAMVTSDDAKANITAALLRNAELEAQHVDVTVNGTEIRLTGHVTSWAAQHQAEFAAWCTPGVTHVDNRLAIT
jgi:osmotically-inducible protein OsmY